jgi:hypothetical protein|tara:strand:- start:14 stop:364 length:351 start_codon:yes stop_codon:yes gene_type:complete
MVLKQKYIKVKRRYDFDEWFISELATCPYYVVNDIVSHLEKYTVHLPELDGWSQTICGVVKASPYTELDKPFRPFFYKLEFLKQTNEIPLYLGVEEISCDDYLDCINKNQTIKLNE